MEDGGEYGGALVDVGGDGDVGEEMGEAGEEGVAWGMTYACEVAHGG